MNKKRLTISSLWIILFIVLIVLLFRQNQYQRTTTKNTVDSITTNVTYHEYDANGQLASIIKSPKVTHYPLNNRSHFIQPRMVFFNANGTQWHVRSDYGNSYNNDVIKLWHHVVLHQPGVIKHPETTIKTNELTFYPRRSLAITHHHAKLMQPGTVLQGDGVIIHTKLGTARILKHSRGLYHPPKQSKNA
ncbi:MAG: LPS export ABC transporter periplasmic protein LptC [Gammaproteobacteria bacterium]|nr:LPS export ABC transporter periplasmic protein LptC [Gammaproteobacteria bacterium]